MSDVHTTEQRSRNMAAIRSKNTRPELTVRSMVHRLGYRYRLHVRDMPGKPDLVFPRFRSVINVHGCYWHMHSCRWGSVVPKTNTEFWQTKRMGNVRRDQKNSQALRRDGWRVLTVWECESKNIEKLRRKLIRFLRGNAA